MMPVDEFQQEPEPWRVLPVARVHGPCEVPHSVTSMLVPHTHLISEDTPVVTKNALAIHIEQYHGRRT
jgi:hypothetical protein